MRVRAARASVSASAPREFVHRHRVIACALVFRLQRENAGSLGTLQNIITGRRRRRRSARHSLYYIHFGNFFFFLFNTRV